MRTILITGAAGFIGFHLSQTMLAEGWRVVGLDNHNDYYDPALKAARGRSCWKTRTTAASADRSRTPAC